jgi:hypothetical protein
MRVAANSTSHFTAPPPRRAEVAAVGVLCDAHEGRLLVGDVRCIRCPRARSLISNHSSRGNSKHAASKLTQTSRSAEHNEQRPVGMMFPHRAPAAILAMPRREGVASAATVGK